MLRLIIALGLIVLFAIVGFSLYQHILGWVYPHVVFANERDLLLGASFNALSFFLLALTILFLSYRNRNHGDKYYFWPLIFTTIGLGLVAAALVYMRAYFADAIGSSRGYDPIQMSAENIKMHLAPAISITVLIAIGIIKEALTGRKIVRQGH